MKRLIISILTVFILFLLQTGIFRFLAFGNCVPNLLLIAVVSYGLMRGEHSGMITGFFCGLLIDVFYMDFIGFFALLYLYVGFGAGKLNYFYIKENYLLPLIATLLAGFTTNFVIYIVLYLLKGHLNFIDYLINVILGNVIYTLVAAVAIYPLMLLTENKIINRPGRKEETDAL